MELRAYQERACDLVECSLDEQGATMLALQVGGGKTVIACELIRRELCLGHTCLFLVHREELVTQARDRLLSFGIEAGIIKAGYKEDRTASVQVACIPSLLRRELPPADFVIFDEAHHIMADSWLRIVSAYAETADVVGITATPERLDGKGLGDVFANIVQPITTEELIESGHLIEPTVYAPEGVDMSGVKIKRGEYDPTDTVERMSKLTGSITSAWKEHAQNRPTLCFAVNVEHSMMISEALTEVGARSMHIDGNSSRFDREFAATGIADGTIDVVTNCGLWLEGFDCPPLSCLIVARPTASLGLHRQMIGRVMRPHPSKTDAIVLDHAGNYERHGLITDEVEWTLDGRPPGQGAPPTRLCTECYAVLPGGTLICPECAYEFPVMAQEVPEVNNPGTLVRVRSRQDEREEQLEAYVNFLRIANYQGYKLGWARNKYKDMFGAWPRGIKHLDKEHYTCRNHIVIEGNYGPTCKTCLRA